MGTVVTRHFVTFYSPGTFFHEQTTQSIDQWDVDKAIEMAHKIKERHGATPFAFQFSTRSRGPQDLDSKIVKESAMYYLGGKIETLEEVTARNDPTEEILRSNMRNNGWNQIVVNTNSWKVVQPFTERDTLLEFQPRRSNLND